MSRFVRTETFPVHTYEVDAFGLLSPAALAGYLQEVAGNHAAELGCGLADMRAKGVGWVLSRQRLEIATPIPSGEVLAVETWPSGVERIMAVRDFLVRRRDGAVVARALTHWLVMDLESRRPVRPDRVLDERYRSTAEHVFEDASAPAPELERADVERPIGVRYQDIDQIQHVTNSSYLAWAIEAVPEETWRACRLTAAETSFLAECRYGGRVVSRLQRLSDREFAHSIAREEDAKVLARLRTAWAPREAAS
ncbi:MAG TPA: acyl-ACP thioesterase domain-containing protein [Anaeromyxobacteraceae bacterium]|nr:acyl-ACP thioesterase domain-containing protein [Anaeromyxobacteraceae bacterium]